MTHRVWLYFFDEDIALGVATGLHWIVPLAAEEAKKHGPHIENPLVLPRFVERDLTTLERAR